MNKEFKSYLVRDERLNDIQDHIEFSVQEGAANLTQQQYNTVSASSSSVQFSIQVPSESTCIDRHVLLRTQFNLGLSITNVTVGEAALVWGQRDALQQFPFNQLVQTATVSINNTSVSVNQRDVLSALLRCLKIEDLQRYQGMCPVYPDNYKDLKNAALAQNNPNASYTNGADHNQYLLPRGCHPVDIQFISAKHANGGNIGGIVSTALDDVFQFNLSFETIEPIFVSPFIFGSLKHNDKAALLGINQLNFVFNLDATLTKLLSYNGSGTCSLSWSTFGTKAQSYVPLCKLYMNYLTLQSSQLVPSKNVVPYIDYPRYVTGIQNTTGIGYEKAGTTTINNIQLNQIPDKFIIFVRKPLSSQTNKDSNTFWPITKINFNFNNQAGLLSNATVNDIYNISVQNGLQQNWYEWSGVAEAYANGNVTPADNGDVKISNKVYTCAGPLIISPARDLSLPTYLSNGSIGQFSIQFTVDYINPEYDANPNNKIAPEIVLICCNSGYLVNQSGQSSVFTGLLNMSEVMDLKSGTNSPALSESDHRLIGGSALHRHLNKSLKHLVRSIGSGAGVSGGGLSAGAKSGGVLPVPPSRGKKSKLDMMC